VVPAQSPLDPTAPMDRLGRNDLATAQAALVDRQTIDGRSIYDLPAFHAPPSSPTRDRRSAFHWRTISQDPQAIPASMRNEPSTCEVRAMA